MLSNSAKYALKAVLYLSLNSNEEEKLMTKDISEKINVPKSYLAKILQDLSRHGLIESSKGPKGGFYLDDNQKNLSLIEIIEVIDGKQRLSSCILGFKECDRENPCVLHNIMGGANNQFVKSLEETTLKNLIADLNSGDSAFPID